MRSYVLFIIVIVILAVTFIARGGEVPPPATTPHADGWRSPFSGKNLTRVAKLFVKSASETS